MGATKILVCCGAGVATSTMVGMKIEELLKEKGYDAVCDHCKVMEVVGLADQFDMLVSNVKMEHAISIPVIQGLPFLTGIGADQALDEIIGYIKK